MKTLLPHRSRRFYLDRLLIVMIIGLLGWWLVSFVSHSFRMEAVQGEEFQRRSRARTVLQQMAVDLKQTSSRSPDFEVDEGRLRFNLPAGQAGWGPAITYRREASGRLVREQADERPQTLLEQVETFHIRSEAEARRLTLMLELQVSGGKTVEEAATVTLREAQ